MTMNAAALLLPHRCLVLSRSALHQLRISLEKGTGVQSATYLQEAGFASGENVYNAFAEWAAAGLMPPDLTALRRFRLDLVPSEAREATHVSLYDETVEGLEYPELWARSVQFHPEAGPGPHDAWGLIDEWIEEVRTLAKAA